MTHSAAIELVRQGAPGWQGRSGDPALVAGDVFRAKTLASNRRHFITATTRSIQL